MTVIGYCFLFSYLISVVFYWVLYCFLFFFFKQKTAYEMRISDWSSDVCSSDLRTTDVPEQRDWKKPAIGDPRLTLCERKYYAERIGRLSDSEYWNKRARGKIGRAHV